MWSSSHLHGPRRSHEESHPTSRSSSPEDGEPRRRTSSDATPRPTPATTRFLNISSEQDSIRNIFPSAIYPERSDSLGSSKRLGFFADKLTSSLSGTAKDSNTPTRNTLLPGQLSLSHSKAESTQSNSLALSPTGITTSTIPTSARSHTSPSKSSYGRTYDPKVVQREMQRLGNLVPSALAPQLSSNPSISSLSLPIQGNITQIIGPLNSADPWGALHVHVLPLFNGEPLRVPIEDLNVLVKRHIQAVVSAAPSRALATLENDTAELIAQGMVTVNAKLKGVEDEKLVARVVEVWGFFWDQVLTYLEGVLLPLQTDPLLSSLYRTPKPQRAASPSSQDLPVSSSSTSTSTHHIDVRTVALRSFRDRVILPPFQRLYTRLSKHNRQDGFQDAHNYQQPRLKQMLLVLSAQSNYLPAKFSLTTPSPQPTAGETAMRDLLRLVNNFRPQTTDLRSSKIKSTLARTFPAGGMPRDRRGRVGSKGRNIPDFVGAGLEDEGFGDDTPRIGAQSYVLQFEREREREFLESLRSPALEQPPTSHDSGGWGLGAGQIENRADDEEDEPSDWEQAHTNPGEQRRWPT